MPGYPGIDINRNIGKQQREFAFPEGGMKIPA
jgi:hypothetical protein